MRNQSNPILMVVLAIWLKLHNQIILSTGPAPTRIYSLHSPHHIPSTPIPVSLHFPPNHPHFLTLFLRGWPTQSQPDSFPPVPNCLPSGWVCLESRELILVVGSSLLRFVRWCGMGCGRSAVVFWNAGIIKAEIYPITLITAMDSIVAIHRQRWVGCRLLWFCQLFCDSRSRFPLEASCHSSQKVPIWLELTNLIQEELPLFHRPDGFSLFWFRIYAGITVWLIWTRLCLWRIWALSFGWSGDYRICCCCWFGCEICCWFLVCCWFGCYYAKCCMFSCSCGDSASQSWTAPHTTIPTLYQHIITFDLVVSHWYLHHHLFLL